MMLRPALCAFKQIFILHYTSHRTFSVAVSGVRAAHTRVAWTRTRFTLGQTSRANAMARSSREKRAVRRDVGLWTADYLSAGITRFAAEAVNVAVAPSAVRATSDAFTDSVLPAWPERASWTRMIGGPTTGGTASVGQMISSTLPAASVDSSTPASPTPGASGPNVPEKPRPPLPLTDAVPEMKLTVGARPVEQPAILASVPAATSPATSMRSRPIRFCGTEPLPTTAPPKPAIETQGSAAGGGAGGGGFLPWPLANATAPPWVAGPVSESVAERLQAPRPSATTSDATARSASSRSGDLANLFMGVPPVR